MEAVVFIVTIPTEAEEKRLKTKYRPSTGKLHQQHADRLDTDVESASTMATDIPTTPVNTEFNGSASQLDVFNCLPQRSASLQALTDDNTRIVHEKFGSARNFNVDATHVPLTTRKPWEGLREILSSTKRKLERRKAILDLSIPSDTSMEIVLLEILKKFQIQDAVWLKDNEERLFQVTFSIDLNEVYENILEKFHEWGIGEREGSSVSVMNCFAAKRSTLQKEMDIPDGGFTKSQKQSIWDRFMNSVRSRLNVAHIVREVRQDAAITFDFCILLVAASILASFGLFEDSYIFLTSSMLISPLMGPIIAGIFGTVIKDRSLCILGLRNELIGIFASTLVGFLFGLVLCFTDKLYGIREGLTTEMLARCELHSLIVGIFTALPSGAAAAIGILGGNIGSLVGVAISSSILPPAVNSGLLWALACAYRFFEADKLHHLNIVKTDFYSNNQATELAVMGSISMCVTMSNVICVYVMGVVVLKVKEIAPVISRNNRQFWKHDIKIARDLNNHDFNTDKAIIDEFDNLPKEEQNALGIDCKLLHDIHFKDTVGPNTWSVPYSKYPHILSFEPNEGKHLTIHHIEHLYSTITQNDYATNTKRRRLSLSRYPSDHAATGTNYQILNENLPRIQVAGPSNAEVYHGTSSSNQTPEYSTPTGLITEPQPRRFIVTPAEDFYTMPSGHVHV